MKNYLAALVLLLCSVVVFAASDPTAQVKAAAQTWGEVLASGDAKKMATLYDTNAYLYATFQNKISSSEGLLSYFKKLMLHPDLNVKFQKQNIRIHHATAINSGLYVFSYKDAGKIVRIPARFTFVYTLQPNGWLIVEHHSSILPDK
ncbi:hypothetical protein BH10PSE19_BH10PSE19_16400 [soil metagenome]